MAESLRKMQEHESDLHETLSPVGVNRAPQSECSVRLNALSVYDHNVGRWKIAGRTAIRRVRGMIERTPRVRRFHAKTREHKYPVRSMPHSSFAHF